MSDDSKEILLRAADEIQPGVSETLRRADISFFEAKVTHTMANEHAVNYAKFAVAIPAQETTKQEQQRTWQKGIDFLRYVASIVLLIAAYKEIPNYAPVIIVCAVSLLIGDAVAPAFRAWISRKLSHFGPGSSQSTTLNDTGMSGVRIEEVSETIEGDGEARDQPTKASHGQK